MKSLCRAKIGTYGNLVLIDLVWARERTMKHGCVILADRHPGLLEGIRGLLDAMFETVVMVADSQSLFDTVQKLNPELAIVDLSLNDSSSMSIMRQCHDRFPDLKFIIISVYDEPDIVKNVIDTGAAGFVLKRSAVTDLIPAIEAVVQGRTYISPLENRHAIDMEA